MLGKGEPISIRKGYYCYLFRIILGIPKGATWIFVALVFHIWGFNQPQTRSVKNKIICIEHVQIFVVIIL